MKGPLKVTGAVKDREKFKYRQDRASGLLSICRESSSSRSDLDTNFPSSCSTSTMSIGDNSPSEVKSSTNSSDATAHNKRLASLAFSWFIEVLFSISIFVSVFVPIKVHPKLTATYAQHGFCVIACQHTSQRT